MNTEGMGRDHRPVAGQDVGAVVATPTGLQEGHAGASTMVLLAGEGSPVFVCDPGSELTGSGVIFGSVFICGSISKPLWFHLTTIPSKGSRVPRSAEPPSPKFLVGLVAR